MNKPTQSGFAAIETILVLVIVAIIGGTGWFVWHAKKVTESSLAKAANSQQVAEQKTPKINTRPVDTTYSYTDFVNCKNTTGSHLSGTIPEKCTAGDKSAVYVPLILKSHTTSTAVVTTVLSKVPDLQSAVLANLKASNICLNAQGQIIAEGGEVVDPMTLLVQGNAATVLVCSARSLYTKQNGSWQYLGATQGWYDCDTLLQYKIPASLIETDMTASATCYDKVSGQLNNYTD